MTLNVPCGHATTLDVGTLFNYVNHSKREFVVLSDMGEGGDKEDQALYCGSRRQLREAEATLAHVDADYHPIVDR